MTLGTNTIVEYVNLKTVPDSGELTVKKSVKAREGVELINSDLTMKFKFTITLTDETQSQTIAPLLEGEKIFGGLIFTDGIATIMLAHDESYTVTGLPAGVSYTVTESLIEPFEMTCDGDTGVIVSGQTQTASFVNTRTEDPKYGAFTLEKLVERGNKEDEFSFTISFTGLLPEGTYEYGNESFTASDKGTATVELSLKSGESVKFDKLPVGAHYSIIESESGYVASFTVTEQNENGMVEMPSGANTVDSTSLSTGSEAVEEDEDALVLFINNIPGYEVPIIKVDQTGDNVTGALLQLLSGNEIIDEWTTTNGAHIVTLTKGIYVLHEEKAPDGWAYAEDIEFEVFTDGTIAVGDEVVTLVSMTDRPTEVRIIKVDEDGSVLTGAKLQILENGEVVFSFTSSETPRDITGILIAGKEYVLHEESAPEGYLVSEDIIFTVANDGSILGEDGNILEVLVMEDPYAGCLEVTKVLIGGDSDRSFNFTLVLTDIDNTAVSADQTYHYLKYESEETDPIEGTVTGDETGKVKFELKADEKILFNDLPVGVNYTVSEESGSYTVVSEGETGTTSKEAVAKVSFTNTVKPTTLVIPVEKSIKGDKQPSKESFTFELKAIGDAPMPEEDKVTVIGAGEAFYGTIEYTSVGTYKYTVTEQEGNALGYTYDTAPKEVEVTVTDNGGQLEAAYTVDGKVSEGVVVTNEYHTGSLKISKTVKGEGADKDKYFTFTISLSCEGEYPYSGSYEGIIKSGDSIKLKHNESITITELPAGTEYEVVETDNDDYVMTSEGTEGVIEKDKTAHAKVTNTKTPPPKTGEARLPMERFYMMLSAVVLLISWVIYDRKKSRKAAKR